MLRFNSSDNHCTVMLGSVLNRDLVSVSVSRPDMFCLGFCVDSCEEVPLHLGVNLGRVVVMLQILPRQCP